MDKIKLTNFKNDNPLKRFPDFQILSNEEASEKVVLLARIFGLKNMSDGQGLLNIITAKSGLIPNISAEDEAFSLNVIFEKQNIKVNEMIFINWKAFEEIDRIRTKDFVEHFEYIWYPSSDDIEIFDETCKWIISISHYGAIKILRE